MALPSYDAQRFGVYKNTDYADRASASMAHASGAYAAMDKKQPKQETGGSTIMDAAILYSIAKGTGVVDGVTNTVKTQFPKIQDYLSGTTTTEAPPAAPGAVPGAQFKPPTHAAAPGAALPQGPDPMATLGQTVAPTAAAAGVNALAGGAAGMGAGLATGTAVGSTMAAGGGALMGAGGTALGGMGAAAAAGGGAALTGAAAGTAVMPVVGTLVGLGAGALLASFM